MILDAHAHYDDPAFDADRDALIASLPAAGIGLVVNAGSDLASSRASVALAERWPFFRAAVGIHPHEASSWDGAAERELRALAAHPRAVALGEIGLDYHYDLSPRDVQKRVFERQLALAEELGLPVVLHEREALGDTLEILARHPGAKGMFHCFSGSPETAAECVKNGWYISLGGAVTFKNAKRPPAVMASVPGDRLLTETDCPYMAPVPFRGRRCDSTMIRRVLEAGAALRNEDEASLEAQIFANGLRFFRVDDL